MNARPPEFFRVGKHYTRQGIYHALKIPESQQGGDWDTGYHRHGTQWFIFAGVGVGGRTGHYYGNVWDGEILVWRGKTKSQLRHKSIQSMVDGSHKVLVFTRSEDRAPFEYQGIARPDGVEDSTPVTIRWRFDLDVQRRPVTLPEEVPLAGDLLEGTTRQVFVNAYERNPVARRRCIDHFGWNCQVCGFDFAETYGELGDSYIHVHHIRDLATVGEEYVVDPIKDLRPVCPNCHAMLHRQRPAMPIEQLADLLVQRRKA